MALILSLETSTSVCSVALHRESKLLAVVEVHLEQAHASTLAVLIDEILKMVGVENNQLAAVSISSGPGSYTGLRIGASTAKGLCYALGIPLIAINPLFALAKSVNNYNKTGALLCPMIDARRMEVYCMVIDDTLATLQPTEAKIIDESSFGEYLPYKEIIFFGNGAEKCHSVIVHKNATFLKNIYPSAAHLGSLAFDKYQNNEFEDVTYFEPFYLKEFLTKKSPKVDSI